MSPICQSLEEVLLVENTVLSNAEAHLPMDLSCYCFSKKSLPEFITISKQIQLSLFKLLFSYIMLVWKQCRVFFAGYFFSCLPEKLSALGHQRLNPVFRNGVELESWPMRMLDLEPWIHLGGVVRAIVQLHN